MSANGAGRIDARFAALAEEGRAGLVTYVMAGDPNYELSREILLGLPEAGADFIEFGMPFTDPMADGPTIQTAGQRSLKAGTTLKKTLALVRELRERDDATPVVLMGYYNPIYSYGNEAFLKDARDAGVDALIIVDLPPEEDGELCLPALDAGLNWIRLATPTTDDKRLPQVLMNTSGFVYYVAIAGITGAAGAATADTKAAVERLKRHTDLPVAVGFGIKTPDDAADVARVADAAVVGSAFCQEVADGFTADGSPSQACVDGVLDLTRALAKGVREARS